MRAQRRTFRIETFQLPKHNGRGARAAAADGDDDVSATRHRELLSAIKHVQNLIEPEEQVSAQILEDYKSQLDEARKMKAELAEIYEAIGRTKREIATLHVTGFNGPEMSRVTDELDAIVLGTEQATETILAAAEEIDQDAATLISLLKKADNQGLADDIQGQVIKIFEACNFQDLTGQRITKVVNAMHFIEERIVRMMEIWGGMEGFKDVEPEELPERVGDEALLNGPSLDTDLDVASQDDIDALFN